jgi:hypothetical protein
VPAAPPIGFEARKAQVALSAQDRPELQPPFPKGDLLFPGYNDALKSTIPEFWVNKLRIHGSHFP